MEFKFIFKIYELTFKEPEVPGFIRSICFNLMAGRKASAELSIKITQDISDIAICLADEVAKTDVFEFIKLFELDQFFDNTFYIKTVELLIAQNEIGAAAKAIMQLNLYESFDMLTLVKRLGEKGKKNREYAIQILQAKYAQFVKEVVEHFSTETHFEFAF